MDDESADIQITKLATVIMEHAPLARSYSVAEECERELVIEAARSTGHDISGMQPNEMSAKPDLVRRYNDLFKQLFDAIAAGKVCAAKWANLKHRATRNASGSDAKTLLEAASICARETSSKSRRYAGAGSIAAKRTARGGQRGGKTSAQAKIKRVKRKLASASGQEGVVSSASKAALNRPTAKAPKATETSIPRTAPPPSGSSIPTISVGIEASAAPSYSSVSVAASAWAVPAGSPTAPSSAAASSSTAAAVGGGGGGHDDAWASARQQAEAAATFKQMQSQRMSANTARDTGNHGGPTASHDAVAEGRSRAEEERERATEVEQAAREAAARRQQEQQHTMLVDSDSEEELAGLDTEAALFGDDAHLEDLDGMMNF